jgi:hypothetical protein
MVLKKFKDFKPASEVLEEYEAGGAKVEVKKTSSGLFAVCINGLEVDFFRTKAAADEAAEDAIEAMESDDEE